MTKDQLANLWAFARGDTAGIDFEKWFLAQDDLEGALGEGLHWNLASASYADRNKVWKLRQSLAQKFEPDKRCECAAIRDIAAVPMGGQGVDERLFETVEIVRDHGGHQWWLYLSKCRVCGQFWMVAQEERIHDNYYLKRMSPQAAQAIVDKGCWPDDFLTFEQVLRLGIESGQVASFLDPQSPALVDTAHDLRRERSDISVEEIATLLAVSPKVANKLLKL